MNICEKCGKQFPSQIKIDGKYRNVSKRKYCLACSPFNKHNTKNFIKSNSYHCNICGDENKKNFYNDKKTICKNCKNKETYILSRKKREYAINKLGGKCVCCGFDKYYSSLDIHHINPNLKDDNFSNMRHWSYSKIDSEIQNCILLCKNCHAAFHHGDLEIKINI